MKQRAAIAATSMVELLLKLRMRTSAYTRVSTHPDAQFKQRPGYFCCCGMQSKQPKLALDESTHSKSAKGQANNTAAVDDGCSAHGLEAMSLQPPT